ncbi:hypothetical protein B0H16DRAFT_1476996 [Mycena metata]|uniref:Uncharacterized protein n=1 Tax=Mycena metata TaxID=1033252 RepID=A0AAD7HBE8_9AGAR|nr:hypothetical protein B0H16DRAFT_1476996 [Mycena metata]
MAAQLCRKRAEGIYSNVDQASSAMNARLIDAVHVSRPRRNNLPETVADSRNYRRWLSHVPLMEVGLGSKRWHIYFSSTTASAILRTSYHQYYFTATKVFFAGAGAAVVASGCIHGILGIPVPSSNLAQATPAVPGDVPRPAIVLEMDTTSVRGRAAAAAAAGSVAAARLA